MHPDQFSLFDNLRLGLWLFQNWMSLKCQDFFFNPPFLQSVLANYKKEKAKETGFSIHLKNRKKKRKSNYKRNIQNCKIITKIRRHQKKKTFDGLDNFVFATIPTHHNAELRKDVIVALHFGVSHKSSIH